MDENFKKGTDLILHRDLSLDSFARTEETSAELAISVRLQWHEVPHYSYVKQKEIETHNFIVYIHLSQIQK